MVDADLYTAIRDEELDRLGGGDQGRLGAATQILDQLVLSDELVPFLTEIAYPKLVGR